MMKGNVFNDNDPLEIFFGTLKTELIHQWKYRTRKEAITESNEYSEVFFSDD